VALLRKCVVAHHTPAVRLTIANLKGGAGKTTTAAHLACLLARDGRTLAIDADPQKSLTRWTTQAGEAWTVPMVGLPVPDLHKRVPGALTEGYAHVVIDTPPEREQEPIVRAAVLAAEVVLIPLAPNLIELDRLAPTLELIEQVWNVHEPALRALLVKGRGNARSRRDARTVLGEWNVPLLEAEVPMLEMYAQSFGSVPDGGNHYAAVLAELREAT